MGTGWNELPTGGEQTEKECCGLYGLYLAKKQVSWSSFMCLLIYRHMVNSPVIWEVQSGCRSVIGERCLRNKSGVADYR